MEQTYTDEQLRSVMTYRLRKVGRFNPEWIADIIVNEEPFSTHLVTALRSGCCIMITRSHGQVHISMLHLPH